MSSAGIAVEALGGEKRWATDRRSDMLGFVRAARRFDASAPPGGGLAGIHVDVEPYGLKAWDRDQRETELSLLRSLRAGTRAARDLPFAADIPFWFDGIGSGHGRGSLAKAIIGATDATTIMAYRDSGPGRDHGGQAGGPDRRVAGERRRRSASRPATTTRLRSRSSRRAGRPSPPPWARSTTASRPRRVRWSRGPPLRIAAGARAVRSPRIGPFRRTGSLRGHA